MAVPMSPWDPQVQHAKRYRHWRAKDLSPTHARASANFTDEEATARVSLEVIALIKQLLL